MKYFVFIVSALFFIGIAINLITLQFGDAQHKLTRYGYGYITGNILLLVVFFSLAFSFGRKVARKYFSNNGL